MSARRRRDGAGSPRQRPPEGLVIAAMLDPAPLIQAAWQARPALRTAPLVIAGDDERILAACPHALASGVRPGQLVAQARLSCPTSMLRAPDHAAGAVLYEDLLDALTSVSPVVEAADPAGGVAYLDGRGLERLWGEPTAVARAARHAAGTAGALVRVGAGPSRLVARVHARRLTGPAEPRCLLGAEARAFLHALPLHEPGFALPEAACDQLDEIGIRTAGALAALPRAGVTLRFDAVVLALWDLLAGAAEPPLKAWAPPARFVARFRSDEDLTDRLVLERLTRRLAGEVAVQLHVRGQATACLTLRLDRMGGARHVARAPLWPAVSAADALARAALPLLEHCLDEPMPHPVEELLLEAAGLGPAQATQAALFGDPLAARQARLESALADQVQRHGAALFGRWHADPGADDGWRQDDWSP
jgi:protein ImuB